MAHWVELVTLRQSLIIYRSLGCWALTATLRLSKLQSSGSSALEGTGCSLSTVILGKHQHSWQSHALLVARGFLQRSMLMTRTHFSWVASLQTLVSLRHSLTFLQEASASALMVH